MAGVAPTRERLRAAFEEHAEGLLRLCVALTGRRDLAEDLVQDAFVRISPKIDGLESSEVGAYLRRIAVNLWRDRIRRMATELRVLATRSPPPEPAAMTEPDEVWTAILHLPHRQRACVVLRYYEDLSEREVAQILGCSVGTVKSQTSRALGKLREELRHED